MGADPGTNGIGDGNLTRTTTYVDSNSAHNRVTQNG
jgi:hypothetical protein